MKQREYAYDNLKFLLIVLVIAGHLADFYTEPGGNASGSLAVAARGLYGLIYIFHMPAFIFVSGLFAKSALSDKSRAMKRTGEFLVLYILCKLLLGLPSMLLRCTFDFQLLSESGIPWFMLSMALWYAMAYVLEKCRVILKKWNVPVILAANIALACILGYTGVIGDFLCLSKTIVFFPFFWMGLHMDAGKLTDKVSKPVCRAVGAVGILLFVLAAVIQPEFLYALRPLLNGRGDAYAQVAENFANMYPQVDAAAGIAGTAGLMTGTVSGAGITGLLAKPAYGVFWRLAHYAAAAFLIYCLLAVIPKKKLAVSVCGERTLQVYFLHYIFLYPLKIVPVVEKMQTVLPTAVCLLFILVVSALLAVLLSARFITVLFERFHRIWK
ncbi:hypothetical protein BRYFOR_05693 [Marvinbryantia formatexigens DSM 14469]|uniref:Acyltransferase 3 domain-containing protein n=1 Tax=Marvinbryantia formatexigens DSM 14469 TaxID=478749 RepID=C6LAP9_9FIRM|nr:acyltransferase family protein [Marvinbryantia formatexigens]EET62030.1 hypothetical protein BRYFOR_05693 [Marvinbryantia formatexigens DSM 14469]UWO26594.1 acyltransferase family protein [Marvinbryantia formatexigens DSM 14469]SDH12666.1 Fucose 4-O-acetylase [Marvinbryantia formatexigens]